LAPTRANFLKEKSKIPHTCHIPPSKSYRKKKKKRKEKKKRPSKRKERGKDKK
jgi:hypothetical protein